MCFLVVTAFISAFFSLVLLHQDGRMLTRGSMVFSYIAHVCVCRGTCHTGVKGQKVSFLKIIDTWSQRNVGMSLGGRGYGHNRVSL